MLIHVKSKFILIKSNNGLGGIQLKEVPVEHYIKNLGIYEEAKKNKEKYDIKNWAFFMAFDNEIPIGAATVASRTKNVHMLDGRDDLSVLWDIRVNDHYKQRGIGTTLFHMAVEWSKSKGLKQMKIESQNINVPGCKFYHKQGAVLGGIDEYAYFHDSEMKDEVQLIWYLDL